MKPALMRSTRQLQQQQRAGKKRPKQRMSREKLQTQEALQEAEIPQQYRNFEQAAVQINNPVKEGLGQTQEHSPRPCQIGQTLTLDGRSVH